MMYDVIILGAGTAGTFALHKLLLSNKNLKIAVIESGRFYAKRRHQVFGALGCLPSGDGKLYLNNLDKVAEIAGHKATLTASKWALGQLSEITNMKLLKDKRPSITAEKRLNKLGIDIELNNHYQLYPKDIHSYSRSIMEELDKNEVFCSFDNEVYKVFKHKTHFSIITAAGDLQGKKVLLSVGRGGWRWASELFAGFGIIEQNDIAKFGIRIEMPATYMKDFNQSHCTLTHGLFEAGPLSHKGTVIPQDHIDFASTSFRSNETRWESDKVSFDLLKTNSYPDNGYQQTERLAKLSFILGNDRVMKEKLLTFMSKKSKLSVLPEFEPFLAELEQLNEAIPELINRASFYAPCISMLPPQIALKPNFMSAVKDLFVVGESAGIPGLLGAMTSGIIAADAMSKG